MRNPTFDTRRHRLDVATTAAPGISAGAMVSLLLGILLLGLSWWSEGMRHSVSGVFNVGLGVMGLATIIQVIFIGLANRSVGPEPVERAEMPPRPAKVVGEIRGPR